MLEEYGDVTKLSRGRGVSMGRTPDRLHGKDFLGRHYMEYIPATAPSVLAGRTSKKQGTRQCKVCSSTTRRPHIRKSTNMQCAEYKVPLCLPYFKEYHTLTDY
ncbi:hypothetical protein Pcinc_017914 [Petrolisthes cinctipes]|uniref:Uncharacterized protein n=1 Tax=Petrolisthes cinctipes TaxID=88211 RepID=A0AAE1KM92_PETCI|nr:hypothetical protein Pcinc_017914 [Petrolisthes cinctipes]